MQVQVYRNLNNGKWSLKARIDGKWAVIGHCDACLVSNPTVRQSEKARQAVIRSGQRSVHCWIVGDLVAIDGFTPFKGRVSLTESYFPDTLDKVVTYNPYRDSTLVYASDRSEFTGSALAAFNHRHQMTVKN